LKTIMKIAAMAVTLLFLLTALPAEAVTTDLELVGEAAGLVLVPAGGKLLDLRNMNPGDTRQATLKLSNNYSKWYHLWLRSRESGGPGDRFA